MKNKNRSNKPKGKAAIKREKPFVEAPAAVFALKPAEPPLAGEALEAKVAEVLCERFRGAAERIALRRKCQGAEHAAIEAAIVSPRVRTTVEPVAQAYALEEVIAVLQLLFSSARAALENEKPSAAQVAALKIIVEILVGKLIERIGSGLWKESTDLIAFSDYEKCLIKNLVQTVRGQRTLVAEGAQRAPDSGQNDERGD